MRALHFACFERGVRPRTAVGKAQREMLQAVSYNDGLPIVLLFIEDSHE